MIHHELFNWHGNYDISINVNEITLIAKYNIIMVLHFSNCIIFEDEMYITKSYKMNLQC